MYALLAWFDMKFFPYEAWFFKSTKLDFAKWE